MNAWCSKVAGNKNSIPGGSHGSEEAWCLYVNRHQVFERFTTETGDNVLVVLHHVGGDAAVQMVGNLDGIVNWILNQWPGWERWSRHQDCSMKQTWNMGKLLNLFKLNNSFYWHIWHQFLEMWKINIERCIIIIIIQVLYLEQDKFQTIQLVLQ